MSRHRLPGHPAGIAALMAIALALPAVAQEWQKIDEFPWRETNLTADQPSVSYDQGSYKFYTTEQRYLRENQALIVSARSFFFQPDILVWNSAGQVVVRCTAQPPSSDPETGQTFHSCSLELSRPPSGNYSIVTTTRDINQGVVWTSGSLWELPGENVATDDTSSDPSTADTRVRRCQQLEGEDRTRCLVEISINEYDPSACDFDPTGGCRRQAAATIMQKCQTITDPLKRAACFLEVGSGWKDVDSCTYADEPDLCVIHVAAESQNPQIVLDRFGDHPDRDALIALYGTLSGDLSAAELIRDNHIADYATIMIGMIMIARGEPLPPDFCGGLRGDYSEENDDLSIEGMLDLCTKSVARGQELVARLQGASEEDWQRIVDDFLKEIETAEDGAADLPPNLSAEPPSSDPGGVATSNGGSMPANCEGLSLLGQSSC